MLTEIWERLRGYGKWVQTEATIKSSDLKNVEVRFQHYLGEDETVDEWRSYCVAEWKDQRGNSHSAQYEVSEDSRLFQLYDGQTVTIHYDPENPDQHYLPGVLRSKVISNFKWKVFPLLCALAYFLLILLPKMLASRVP
jgi:hypothetical protein